MKLDGISEIELKFFEMTKKKVELPDANFLSLFVGLLLKNKILKI